MEIPWGALIALCSYIIASTVGFIWWMATITVTMQFMRDSIQEIMRQNSLYATKVELAEKLTPLKVSLDKAWEKIDHLIEAK